jgi:hypothetical protein
VNNFALILRVSENRILRRIVRPRGEDVKEGEGNYIMRSLQFALFGKYYYCDQITDEIGGTCSTHRKRKKFIQISGQRT